VFSFVRRGFFASSCLSASIGRRRVAPLAGVHAERTVHRPDRPRKSGSPGSPTAPAVRGQISDPDSPAGRPEMVEPSAVWSTGSTCSVCASSRPVGKSTGVAWAAPVPIPVRSFLLAHQRSASRLACVAQRELGFGASTSARGNCSASEGLHSGNNSIECRTSPIRHVELFITSSARRSILCLVA
jgi:hypothetical protein